VKDLSWINKIPSKWEIKPLRSVANCLISNVDKIPSDNEIPVRLCNYTNVYNNERITLQLDFMKSTATAEEITKFGLVVEDVIITKDSESWNDIGVPALVYETASDLVCGYHLALLRPLRDKLHGTFLLRCLQAKPIQIQLELAANGVTRFGIPKSDIGSMVLPIPPLAEQHRIADYLDRETARIDALVAAKQRALNLLAEKRKAVIAEAVTRGLDKLVNLNSTQTKRLKYLVELRRVRIDRQNNNLPYVGLEDIESYSGKLIEEFKLQESGEDGESLNAIFEIGDVLFCKLRPYLAKVWVATFQGRCTTELLVMQPLYINPKFLQFVCLTDNFITQVSASTFGSKMPRADWDFIGNLAIFVPDMASQHVIVEHIIRETVKLDALVAATERSIDLLNERRAALISAAVTGQIPLAEMK